MKALSVKPVRCEIGDESLKPSTDPTPPSMAMPGAKTSKRANA